ncbi:hypothetical protein FK268_09210 [Tsukamurella sputi]|uniref:tRNA nuclease CdiA C-terminal domain-containing protein n=1 Tax=Tsukamurella sputi TaxID=2591848 RepID=A0A5C5RQK2_9ACTN|nr:hypothetical protein [Tsukamurella sputi]TWS25359.1 hypothetical protein FK268_09210 [Tsukamurella sputi]
MTEPVPPAASAAVLDAVGLQRAQAAITKAIVDAMLRALNKFGVPATAGERAQFAQRVLPEMMRAREQSYTAAVAHMRYTALHAGQVMPEPAEIRRYGMWAIESAIEQANVPDPTAMDQVTRAAAKRPDPRRQIAANLARHALAAGRDAIVATAEQQGEEVGWARVLTGAENCAFCMMLVSRGPVYRSQRSAGFRAHTHCDCSCTLVFHGKRWHGQDDYERLEDLWAEVTRGESGKGKFDAWRRHIDGLNRAEADDEPTEDWRARQDALPIDFHGDRLEPHEIQFVERFLAAGERFEWIPRDKNRRSTNDFVWTSNGGIPTELKSTKARYESIHGTIVKAASRAARHGVVKDNFVIDLGDQELTRELRSDMERFNVGRQKYRLSGLWVMSRGEITQIALAET